MVRARFKKLKIIYNLKSREEVKVKLVAYIYHVLTTSCGLNYFWDPENNSFAACTRSLEWYYAPSEK